MSDVVTKKFAEPDSREEVTLGLVEIVRLGSITVGRETLYPGWRWSTHTRPIVGTELCEYHHVGIQISGRWICRGRDGIEVEIGPGEVYDIAPGHDSWVVGDEPCVNIDFQGVAGWGLPPAPGERVLTTILFTDIVDSTTAAERMGDRRWATLLMQHSEDVGHLLTAHGGRQVKSTGDGFLATFEAPAGAVRCAVAIARSAHRLGLAIRAGVHTGEVERTGDDLRGVAVHLASRVMDVAGPGEVIVTATTRELVAGTELVFVEKGSFELKGISGPRTLFRVSTD